MTHSRDPEAAGMVQPAVAILGTGPISTGLAHLAAQRGCSVVVIGRRENLETSRGLLMAELAHHLKAGRVGEQSVAARLDAITFSPDEDAVKGQDFVFDLRPVARRTPQPALERVAHLERLLEDPEATLLVDPGRMSLPDLAESTVNPERVVGVRFLAPVTALALMELITTRRSDPDVVARSAAFLTDVLGKNVLHSADEALFADNALPIPYVVSAIRLSESRLSNTDDIDAAHIPGCRRPIGPLEFADLIGLDTLRDLVEALHAEDPGAQLHLPESLVRLIDRGHLGRKSGRGFFRYPTATQGIDILHAHGQDVHLAG